MKIATIGNLRTAVAAQSSLGKGFKLALNSGAVMGFALVSLAVLGFVLIYLFTTPFFSLRQIAHILFECYRWFWIGRLFYCKILAE